MIPNTGRRARVLCAYEAAARAHSGDANRAPSKGRDTVRAPAHREPGPARILGARAEPHPTTSSTPHAHHHSSVARRRSGSGAMRRCGQGRRGTATAGHGDGGGARRGRRLLPLTAGRDNSGRPAGRAIWVTYALVQKVGDVDDAEAHEEQDGDGAADGGERPAARRRLGSRRRRLQEDGPPGRRLALLLFMLGAGRRSRVCIDEDADDGILPHVGYSIDFCTTARAMSGWQQMK